MADSQRIGDSPPAARRTGIPTGGLIFKGVAATCWSATRLTGSDGAVLAVMTGASKQRELVFATDPIAQQIDELQFTLGEGPCLDAYVAAQPLLCPRLGTGAEASRWPAFCADAVDMGVSAVFAFPVPGHRRPMGVLELYRREAGDLDVAELESASACAVAIGHTLMDNWDALTATAGSADLAIESAALHEAAVNGPSDPFSRSQVYVAAGMVAVQLAVPVDEGLDRLRAYAYGTGESVTEIAADIVARRLSMAGQRDDAKDG